MIANDISTLTVYDRLANQDARGAVASLGLTIAKSGMFGSLTEVQGELLGLECFTQQMPPMQLALRYHVIDNKLSMKADAMLAEFNERGGKHKILCRTAEKAEVELTWDGYSHTFSFSWEEAKQEPFVYNGKQSDILKAIANNGKLEVKAKYATPRSRSQMLWARVTSDGVRAMCPGVNFGRYTPEELGEDEEAVIVDDKKKKGSGSSKAATTTTAAYVPPVVETKQEEAVVDAEFEVADPHKQALHTLEGFVSAAGPDARTSLCKRFGVGALIGLSFEQITTVLEEYRSQAGAGSQAAESPADDASFDTEVLDQQAADAAALNQPCSNVQIEAFKELIAAITPTCPDIGSRVMEQLKKLHQQGQIEEARASRLTAGGMDKLLCDLKRGDSTLTQFKVFVESPF